MGLEGQNTYNSQWVTKEKGVLDSLDSQQAKVEVTDISQRELGKFYTDADIASGKYKSEGDKRVTQAIEARQKEWALRMGLRTIGEENPPGK